MKVHIHLGLTIFCRLYCRSSNKFMQNFTLTETYISSSYRKLKSWGCGSVVEYLPDTQWALCFPASSRKQNQQQNKNPHTKVNSDYFKFTVWTNCQPGNLSRYQDLLTNYGINAFITKPNLRIPKTLLKIYSGINTQELQFSAN